MQNEAAHACLACMMRLHKSCHEVIAALLDPCTTTEALASQLSVRHAPATTWGFTSAAAALAAAAAASTGAPALLDNDALEPGKDAGR